MYREDEGEGEKDLSVVEEESEVRRRRLTNESSAMHVSLVDHNITTRPRMKSREIQTDPWCVPSVVLGCADAVSAQVQSEDSANSICGNSACGKVLSELMDIQKQLEKAGEERA